MKTKKRSLAGAPHTPFDKNGRPNKMWVKENGNSHATFVVDPQGTGTYCHVTITYSGDPTKYHYGYEIRNPRHRALGRHFWTTPYVDDHKFTPAIQTELRRLYLLLCNQDGSVSSISRPPSSSSSRPPSSSSSRPPQRPRRGSHSRSREPTRKSSSSKASRSRSRSPRSSSSAGRVTRRRVRHRHR